MSFQIYELNSEKETIITSKFVNGKPAHYKEHIAQSK